MKFAGYLIMAATAGLALATPAAAQEAAPAPIATKSGTVGAAPAGKAQVVFWRPGTIIGGALGCTVRENEDTNEIARLGAGKYWVHVAEPGKHVFYTTGEKTDKLNMELEPDETYFVKCSIGMGIMAGRPQVSPSDREAFAKKAKGMNLWVPKAEKAKKEKK
jgi:hypothetical protein